MSNVSSQHKGSLITFSQFVLVNSPDVLGALRGYLACEGKHRLLQHRCACSYTSLSVVHPIGMTAAGSTQLAFGRMAILISSAPCSSLACARKIVSVHFLSSTCGNKARWKSHHAATSSAAFKSTIKAAAAAAAAAAAVLAIGFRFRFAGRGVGIGLWIQPLLVSGQSEHLKTHLENLRITHRLPSGHQL